MTTGFSDNAEQARHREADARISKRQYLSSLQCHKRLWLETFRIELASPPTPAELHRREQGIDVGRLAHRLFPNGLYLENELDFDRHLARSHQALADRRPLFEPAFATNSAYARADILVPTGVDQWAIVEVKSTTKVYQGQRHPRLEARYLDDLTFQLYVFEQSGISIDEVSLLLVDSSYRRGKELEPARLFRKAVATEEVRNASQKVPRNISSARALLAESEQPDVAIGPQCTRPYDCPFIAHCWAEVPQDSVHTLYRGGAKAYRLWASGHRTLPEVPNDFPLSGPQTIQIAAARAGQPRVDHKAIAHYLDGLTFPLYFLDFETFQSAVPPYEGVRPYQQIPFQFSLHVLVAPSDEPVHHEFLAPDASDPRPALLSALKDALAGQGSIVSYNAPFEQTRMAEMADAFSDHAPWIRRALRRFKGADLLQPFRTFSYYHPRQRGSASIKDVLPVLTSVSYAHLPIANGVTAASEFQRITVTEPDAADVQSVRANLLRYCAQDTMALVEIFRRLRELIAQGQAKGVVP